MRFAINYCWKFILIPISKAISKGRKNFHCKLSLLKVEATKKRFYVTGKLIYFKRISRSYIWLPVHELTNHYYRCLERNSRGIFWTVGTPLCEDLIGNFSLLLMTSWLPGLVTFVNVSIFSYGWAKANTFGNQNGFWRGVC